MDRRARSALYDGDTRARAFGRAHGAAVASVFLLIFVFRALVLIILVLPVKFLIIVLVTPVVVLIMASFFRRHRLCSPSMHIALTAHMG